MGTRLAGLSDLEIGDLIRSVPRPQRGWGKSGAIKLGLFDVFAKRIPITEIELANVDSTKNHFGLPPFYSYGFGSVGFGVWREITAAKKASDWALASECSNFPLMYHYRTLRLEGDALPLDADKHARYVNFWNNDQCIGGFIEERTRATHEVVIFLEYFPKTLVYELPDKLGNLAHIVKQMSGVTDFIRSKELVHFDCHHFNVVTDDSDCYLTDFGLASCHDFELSVAEREFLERHTYYDKATFIARAASYLTERYRASPDSLRRGILDLLGTVEPESNLKLRALLLDNLEELVASGLMHLPAEYVAEMIKYREVVRLFTDFTRSMTITNDKTARFDDERLRAAVLTAEKGG
ncbi:MAG: hypothetical protein AAF543_08790 [Pseudomonadota bacterium]